MVIVLNSVGKAGYFSNSEYKSISIRFTIVLTQCAFLILRSRECRHVTCNGVGKCGEKIE